jgi:hypothetical protein
LTENHPRASTWRWEDCPFSPARHVTWAKTREIASWQFSAIPFINNGLNFSQGTHVKKFETLRDHTMICHERHGHVLLHAQRIGVRRRTPWHLHRRMARVPLLRSLPMSTTKGPAFCPFTSLSGWTPQGRLASHTA